MEKNYIEPRIRVRKIEMDAMMLPDSVGGSDATPPVVNSVKDDALTPEEESRIIPHYNVWDE